MENSLAIVLAAFGVAHLEALPGITNVSNRVRRRFPHTEVRLAFTSNQIRRIWQKRAADSAWREAYPGAPAEILEVRGTLAAISCLQDWGYRNIVVQPLHIYAGEEYQDLASYVAGLKAIRTVKQKWMPFDHILLGRPALGAPGPSHPYLDDLATAARALAEDVAEARAQDAALVYVGHGNHLYSTGVYLELEQVLRRAHSYSQIWIGAVEGMFGAKHVLEEIKRASVKKVILRPLMLVAGGHARDDMCGEEDDSWRGLLSRAGLEVTCRLRGLGEKHAWADIYIEHIRDTMQDHGLEPPA